MDYKNKFELIINKYQQNKEPVFVDFRELVNSIKFVERATHSIHPYTAKLLPNIPFFFSNNSFFIQKGEKVLDPFCGSGTVLLEAKIAGLNPYGSDANPLARLITKTKCNNFDKKKIIDYQILLKNIIYNNDYDFTLQNTKVLDFWFEKHIQLQLKKIQSSISTINEIKYREFYQVCFSNCVRKVSFADSRISVPVKINPNKFPQESIHRIAYQKKVDELKIINVFDKFFEIVQQNIKRLDSYKQSHKNRYVGKIISNESRDLSKLADNSIDLIITSPPYAGAQKYIRASSLSLHWLGYNNLSDLDKKNIGRENYKKQEYNYLYKTGIENADNLLQKIFDKNPLRACIASKYLIEMTQALKESTRVLKENRYLILVASNNVVCDFEFKTQEYLKEIAVNLGNTLISELVDDIRSYGLMTKRNKTASIITCEHIMIFKKNESK